MPLSIRTSLLLLPLVALAVAGCSDSDPAAPVNIRPHTLVVENRLLAPVSLNLNGIDMGTLEAGATRFIQRGELDTVELKYVISPSAQVPFGDTIRGGLGGGRNVLSGVDTAPRMIIDADLTGDGLPDIFAPGLKNWTAVPIAVGVNIGTPFENRTGMVIQAGDTSGAFRGYFYLPRGPQVFASVRVYRTDKAFDPNDFLVSQFGFSFDDTDINPRTGYTELDITQTPP